MRIDQQNRELLDKDYFDAMLLAGLLFKLVQSAFIPIFKDKYYSKTYTNRSVNEISLSLQKIFLYEFY